MLTNGKNMQTILLATTLMNKKSTINGSHLIVIAVVVC